MVPLLRAVARLSGPGYLLMVALTYMLGAGIAKYLGFPPRAPLVAMGLVMAVLLQAALQWLEAAFRPLREQGPREETEADPAQVRKAVLYSAIGALAAAGTLAFSILTFERAPVGAAFCLGLSAVLILIYATPPMRAAGRGFGELLLAAQIAYLTPTLGFLLESGSIHGLLVWCTAALTVLFVATLIALELPSFADDVRRDEATILTKVGWEVGLNLHHALMLTSYVVLGLCVFSGFSITLIGPAFLTLPFALLQVFLLRGIARGAKPIWSLLRVNALAVFALTTYFLTLSFWLR